MEHSVAYYPIVKKNSSLNAITDGLALPAFYMGDFSVLGFRVDNCDDAAQLLNHNDYEVQRTDAGTNVKIETGSQVHAVVQLLKENGLACDLADIADGMYQG